MHRLGRARDRQFQRGKIVVEAMARDTTAEFGKLDHAIESAKRELGDLFEEVWKKAGPGKAAIFRAHSEFLEDPEMIDAARALIREGHSAGWSWQHTYEERADVLAGMKDPVLAGRAIDLRDVGRRVLRLLADRVEDEPAPAGSAGDPASPTTSARRTPRGSTRRSCWASARPRGGPTSHTAIIARSLDIPAVVGAGRRCSTARGHAGGPRRRRRHALVDPADEGRRAARAAAAQADLSDRARPRAARRYQPAIMTDGARVEVVANISDAARSGAGRRGRRRGRGPAAHRVPVPGPRRRARARTSSTRPTATMVEALDGLPLIIRTLDIGGDKDVPYLRLPRRRTRSSACAASACAWRGRSCSARSCARSSAPSALGPVRDHVPDDRDARGPARRAKAIAEEVRRELGAEPVEIGIMIEVPSAVMMAPELAREVDFFSIGTNDLTQYVLAMDRLHPVLAKQADGLHPGGAADDRPHRRAAKAAGKWVGVCGGIAGDPQGVAILVGLGRDRTQREHPSIPSIAAVKAHIRGMTMDKARALAQRALACRQRRRGSGAL